MTDRSFPQRPEPGTGSAVEAQYRDRERVEGREVERNTDQVVPQHSCHELIDVIAYLLAGAPRDICGRHR